MTDPFIAIPNNRKFHKTIFLEVKEVTSRCPLNHQEDFGTMSIQFEPENKIPEMKSFRDFIRSFRDIEIWQEDFVDAVLDALVRMCNPYNCEVELTYNTRGGIDAKVRGNYFRCRGYTYNRDDLLTHKKTGILTTGDKISLPVNFVWDRDTDTILIITDGRSKRVQHIKEDFKCSFLIENSDCDWNHTSALFMKGDAVISSSIPEQALLKYRNKFPEYEEIGEECGEEEMAQDVLIAFFPHVTKYFNSETINEPGGV